MPSPGSLSSAEVNLQDISEATPGALALKSADWGNPLDLFKEGARSKLVRNVANPLDGPLFDLKPADVGAVPSPIEARAKSLEQEFGVKSARDIDGRIKYVLKANGKDFDLGSFDASEQGMLQARERLSKLQADKAASLEKKYKVTFAASNEAAGEGLIIGKDGSVTATGKQIKARSARLDEMFAVEAALLRSQPSHLTKTGEKGLKLYFLAEDMFVGLPDLATYQLDKNNVPSIYMAPDATANAPLTELDAARDGLEPRTSLESILIHEIAHNGQRNMGWGDAATLQFMASKIGWIPDPSEKGNWLLRGAKGELFKQNPRDAIYWYRVDALGRPADTTGRVTTIDKAEFITVFDMHTRAAVRPISLYFTNPIEMFAEGMRDFRLGTNNRADLLYLSPDLYKAVKDQDEEELAGIYGLDPNNTLRYVRDFNGLLTEGTPEARARIADLERRVRNESIKAYLRKR